jgi:hypothetical protein
MHILIKTPPGWIHRSVPGIIGAISEGETLDELMANMGDKLGLGDNTVKPNRDDYVYSAVPH